MTDDSCTDGTGTHRASVRERYAALATTGDGAGCCGSSTDQSTSCCDSGVDRLARLGYDEHDVATVTEADAPALGSGNPIALADLDEGETVLDLGAGAGTDCIIAAHQVGADGHVIGVDMTPEMIDRARETIATVPIDNVEFRLGEIEHLPVADASVDVVVSNCVVNLSPDKQRVFTEAFRVLRPGGRLAISDIVRTDDLPVSVREDPAALAGCIAGAATVDELERFLEAAGFASIEIELDDDGAARFDTLDGLEGVLATASITAHRPSTR